jgi:hypothetical protein
MAGTGRSIPDIFADVVAQFTGLVETEARLARSEVSDSIGKASAGLSLVIGGAVLLIPALVVLLDAAVAALTEQGHLAPYWSALIVGGTVLILGLVLLAVGGNRLRPANMIPARTIHQFQRDAAVAKDQLRERHELHRAA